MRNHRTSRRARFSTTGQMGNLGSANRRDQMEPIRRLLSSGAVVVAVCVIMIGTATAQEVQLAAKGEAKCVIVVPAGLMPIRTDAGAPVQPWDVSGWRTARSCFVGAAHTAVRQVPRRAHGAGVSFPTTCGNSALPTPIRTLGTIGIQKPTKRAAAQSLHPEPDRASANPATRRPLTLAATSLRGLRCWCASPPS